MNGVGIDTETTTEHDGDDLAHSAEYVDQFERPGDHDESNHRDEEGTLRLWIRLHIGRIHM